MIESTVVAAVPVSAGGWERWRGECRCGWRGEPKLTQSVARGDARDHERGCERRFQLELVVAA